MPTISYFFGIYIKMYFDDHFPAHFHAEYQQYEAQIAIIDGKVITGKLPPSALRMVEEWRKLHIDELRRAWDLAKDFKLPPKIAPLEE